jgi:hypothetical protein
LTGSRCLYRDVVTQALVPQQRNGSLGWLPRLRESVCGVLIVHEFSGLYHGNLYAYLDSFESKYVDTCGSRILWIEGGAGESWWSPIQKLHVRAELMTVEVSLLQAQISQRDLTRIAALLAEMGRSLGLETPCLARAGHTIRP